MGPKTVQSKLLVELTGQPARAPLSRPMQLHRVEPHLHTVRLRVFGKRPIGRKQKELRVVASVFIKGFDLPTPSFMLAIVDLAEIQHLALHHFTAAKSSIQAASRESSVRSLGIQTKATVLSPQNRNLTA